MSYSHPSDDPYLVNIKLDQSQRSVPKSIRSAKPGTHQPTLKQQRGQLLLNGVVKKGTSVNTTKTQIVFNGQNNHQLTVIKSTGKQDSLGVDQNATAFKDLASQEKSAVYPKTSLDQIDQIWSDVDRVNQVALGIESRRGNEKEQLFEDNLAEDEPTQSMVSFNIGTTQMFDTEARKTAHFAQNSTNTSPESGSEKQPSKTPDLSSRVGKYEHLTDAPMHYSANLNSESRKLSKNLKPAQEAIEIKRQLRMLSQKIKNISDSDQANHDGSFADVLKSHSQSRQSQSSARLSNPFPQRDIMGVLSQEYVGNKQVHRVKKTDIVAIKSQRASQVKDYVSLVNQRLRNKGSTGDLLMNTSTTSRNSSGNAHRSLPAHLGSRSQSLNEGLSFHDKFQQNDFLNHRRIISNTQAASGSETPYSHHHQESYDQNKHQVRLQPISTIKSRDANQKSYYKQFVSQNSDKSLTLQPLEVSLFDQMQSIKDPELPDLNVLQTKKTVRHMPGESMTYKQIPITSYENPKLSQRPTTGSRGQHEQSNFHEIKQSRNAIRQTQSQKLSPKSPPSGHIKATQFALNSDKEANKQVKVIPRHDVTFYGGPSMAQVQTGNASQQQTILPSTIHKQPEKDTGGKIRGVPLRTQHSYRSQTRLTNSNSSIHVRIPSVDSESQSSEQQTEPYHIAKLIREDIANKKQLDLQETPMLTKKSQKLRQVYGLGLQVPQTQSGSFFVSQTTPKKTIQIHQEKPQFSKERSNLTRKFPRTGLGTAQNNTQTSRSSTEEQSPMARSQTLSQPCQSVLPDRLPTFYAPK